jgi:hypothetical protein
MSEQRREPRQKSLLRGIGYFDNSPCATECTIRDISESGARLRFSTQLLGAIESLELEIPLRGQKHQCRIVWRADNDVGVEFEARKSNSQNEAGDSITGRISRLEAEVVSLKNTIRRLTNKLDRGDGPPNVA